MRKYMDTNYHVLVGGMVLISFLLLPSLGWSQEFSPDVWEKPQFDTITEFLDKKAYQGGLRRYEEQDLVVPKEVDEALNRIGISHYAILRNEVFARNGYRFKNPIFQYLYTMATWYKPNAEFKFSLLNRNENLNANYIKAQEDSFDFKNIARWFDSNKYIAKTRLYATRLDFEVPKTVKISLNHLKITPARLLRSEILARNGFIFNDANMQKIFSGTNWYQGVSKSVLNSAKSMTEKELGNLKLLRMREWVDILESVNFTLPKDVISIPALGYNAIFVRTIKTNGLPLYYSSHMLWPVLTQKKGLYDPHQTDTDALVSPAVIAQIKNQPDPRKKLVLFFEHKRYRGYTNTLIFNHSDMEAPSYLVGALKALDLNWLILLRKEIHARKGARFSDKKAFSILGSTSWYKPRYDLILATETRFPATVRFTRAELINFSLMEGEELHESYQLYRQIPFLADLSGNLYFIKVGKAETGRSGWKVKLGWMEPTYRDYEKIKDLDMVELMQRALQVKFDAAQYEEEEKIKDAVGS